MIWLLIPATLFVFGMLLDRGYFKLSKDARIDLEYWCFLAFFFVSLAEGVAWAYGPFLWCSDCALLGFIEVAKCPALMAAGFVGFWIFLPTRKV